MSGRSTQVVAQRRSVLDNRVYIALQRITGSVALSAMFVVASLPLVTVAPALAAVFGVIRDDSRGQDNARWRSFWRHFGANVRQALAVQVIWMVAAVAFVQAAQIASTLPATAGAVVRSTSVLAGLLTMAASIYAFPLMVGYHLDIGRLLRLSALFAIGRPGITARCLAVVLVAGLLTYLVPAVPLLVTALVASIVYSWCEPAIVAAAAPEATQNRMGMAGGGRS